MFRSIYVQSIQFQVLQDAQSNTCTKEILATFFIPIYLNFQTYSIISFFKPVHFAKIASLFSLYFFNFNFVVSAHFKSCKIHYQVILLTIHFKSTVHKSKGKLNHWLYKIVHFANHFYEVFFLHFLIRSCAGLHHQLLFEIC